MSILDISNWTINEINNSIDAFKDTSLTDIGMVNCDIESINIVGGITTATLWIDEEIGIDGYTGTAPLKIYKEDKIEIKLNSPLLMRDTIEVKDGKLCHVHRMGKVVLNGSEEWGIVSPNNNGIKICSTANKVEKGVQERHYVCDKLATPFTGTTYNQNRINSYGQLLCHGQSTYSHMLYISIDVDSTEEAKQWLSENPITLIYETLESIYENITPLQSEIVLKTFEECNMNIVTNLPIKTNVSYRTNVPSISTLSNRVAEVSESDNVIHNLINIIDDEVDE